MSSKFPKILTTIFLFVFMLQLVGLIFLLISPPVIQAATAEFVPQVDIPGSNLEKIQPYGSTKAIGEYIKAIYKYAIGIVGILAAVVLMFGGVLWITAGGNNEKISSAKAWIGASLTGLVLALCSYMILAIINPALVEFKVTKVDKVGELKTGCCAKGEEYLGVITKSQCDSKKGSWGGEGSFWDSKSKECVVMSKDTSDCSKNSGKDDYYLCYIDGRKGYCLNEKCLPCLKSGELVTGNPNYQCCDGYFGAGVDINEDPQYECK